MKALETIVTFASAMTQSRQKLAEQVASTLAETLSLDALSVRFVSSSGPIVAGHASRDRAALTLAQDAIDSKHDGSAPLVRRRIQGRTVSCFTLALAPGISSILGVVHSIPGFPAKAVKSFLTACLRPVAIALLARQAAVRLEERDFFYGSLLDHVSNAVIATDLERRIVFWNRHAQQLCHWSADEVRGKKLAGLILPERRVRESRDEELGMVHESVWNGEFLVRRKDGSTFNAMINETPTLNAAGTLAGFVAIAVDISERKQSEEQLRNSQEQLRALTAHLHWVREKERSHISREIHDELGQALTGLKMDLAWMDHRLDETPATTMRGRLKEKVGSMLELVDSTIQQVRKITTELRPRILDELGVVAAIEWQSREFQTRTGIQCRFQCNAENIALDDERATAVFRIFQETLTNVMRHAKGSKVEVSLNTARDGLTLQVRDNGRGITTSKIKHSQSLGLLGMRERALLSEGHLTITGVRGKGTTVTVWIPAVRANKVSPEALPPTNKSGNGDRS